MTGATGFGDPSAAMLVGGDDERAKPDLAVLQGLGPTFGRGRR